MNPRNKRPRSKLTDLHNNFANILGEESLDQLLAIARLRRAWHDIVGAMMASRTEPVQIELLAKHGDNGSEGVCLWVAVDHPIMAQQIRFLRDDIRKACFKHARISNMHQVRSRIQPGAGIQAAKLPRKPQPLSCTQKRKLALDVASIKDRRLRKAVFQARMAQVIYAEQENI